jgi:hypothetical protein
MGGGLVRLYPHPMGAGAIGTPSAGGGSRKKARSEVLVGYGGLGFASLLGGPGRVWSGWAGWPGRLAWGFGYCKRKK